MDRNFISLKFCNGEICNLPKVRLVQSEFTSATETLDIFMRREFEFTG